MLGSILQGPEAWPPEPGQSQGPRSVAVAMRRVRPIRLGAEQIVAKQILLGAVGLNQAGDHSRTFTMVEDRMLMGTAGGCIARSGIMDSPTQGTSNCQEEKLVVRETLRQCAIRRFGLQAPVTNRMRRATSRVASLVACLSARGMWLADPAGLTSSPVNPAQ